MLKLSKMKKLYCHLRALSHLPLSLITLSFSLRDSIEAVLPYKYK